MDSSEWRRREEAEALLREPEASREESAAAQAAEQAEEAWRTWILSDARFSEVARHARGMIKETEEVMSVTSSTDLWRKAQGAKDALLELLGWVGARGGMRLKDGGFEE